MLYTRAFIGMALANLFTTTSFAAFFSLPLFITAQGGTKTDIGVLMGAFALASVLGRPWISELVDRLGRKHSYTIGSAMMTLAPIGYLLLPEDLGLARIYWPLLGLRLGHGVGLAICFTAAFTYVADIVPPHRINEGIGIFGISGLIGLGLGPALAEPAITQTGFAGFFVLTALLSGAAFLCHLPLRESFRMTASTPHGPSFFQVFRRIDTLQVSLLAFLFGFGISASGNFIFAFAEAQRLQRASLYYLAYSAAAVLSRVAGGRVADRIGERRVIAPAFLMTGLGFLSLLLPPSHGILILAGALSGIGHGFLYPSLNTLAVRDQPASERGKITGIFTGSIDVGILLGSILMGYLGDWAGFDAIFLASGLSLLVALVVFRNTRNWAVVIRPDGEAAAQ